MIISGVTPTQEMMAGSYITKSHIFKQEESVTTELLNKTSNVPGLTRKHDAGGGYHNQSNRRSAKPIDHKLNTCEDSSFPFNTVEKEDVAKVMGKTLNMVEGFINDMLPKSTYLQAPTIVEDNNKTTNRNEIGDLNPTATDNKDNNSVERANTVLNTNNILGAHVMEEKKKWFYQCADNYDVWNSDPYPPEKGIEMGRTHTFIGDTDIFKLAKTKHNGKSKTRIMSEVSTSNKSDFCIGKRQS